MADYQIQEVRSFLIDHFDDTEINRFCHDYFREVSSDFTNAMTKSQKAENLIEYCERHEKIPDLHLALNQERAEQYVRHFGAALLPEKQNEELFPAGRDAQLVFISYAYEDTEIAHKLAGDLEKDGWRIWIAPDSILPGEKWPEAINRGLDHCSRFIVVLTKTSVYSSWVKDETNVAIGLEHENKLLFFPLEFENCNPPSLWTTYQFISFRMYDSGLQNLLPALKREKTTTLLKPGATTLKKIEKFIPAGSLNRRAAAILVITVLLSLFILTFLGIRMAWSSLKASQCPPHVGQLVHVSKGVNAWSQHDVTHGGVTQIFNRHTSVYIINGREWGIISYGTDVGGWWWEVSDTPDGKSLGWVWEGQMEECR